MKDLKNVGVVVFLSAILTGIINFTTENVSITTSILMFLGFNALIVFLVFLSNKQVKHIKTIENGDKVKFVPPSHTSMRGEVVDMDSDPRYAKVEVWISKMSLTKLNKNE
jgi:transcription antitermination factor NusG